MEQPYFTPPGEGERVGPRSQRVLAELPDLEVLELFFEADFEGVDPHTHSDHTDSFYVLEGEVEFFIDGELHRAGPGAFVSVPREVSHGFRPAGGPIRVLNIHAPHVGFTERIRNQ